MDMGFHDGQTWKLKCDLMGEHLPPVREALSWIPALQMDSRKKKKNPQ